MHENAVAYFNLGNAHRKSKNNQAAIKAYKASLSIEPDHEVYLNLGNAQQDVGDGEGALESYYAVLQIDPNYPAAYVNIGFLLQESGNYQGAIANYQRAVELAPQNRTANHFRRNRHRGYILRSPTRLAAAYKCAHLEKIAFSYL